MQSDCGYRDSSDFHPITLFESKSISLHVLVRESRNCPLHVVRRYQLLSLLQNWSFTTMRSRPSEVGCPDRVERRIHPKRWMSNTGPGSLRNLSSLLYAMFLCIVKSLHLRLFALSRGSKPHRTPGYITSTTSLVIAVHRIRSYVIRTGGSLVA